MSKTLLLADDSVVIQKLVGLSFANEDVEIIATDNGDDAIARARDVNPDIVLADVVMPGKSGYEVCEAIKQDPDLAHVPVLLLTGTFEAFDEARAADAGANGQITKPFEAQSLVERVNTVMREGAAAPPIPAAPAEDQNNAASLSAAAMVPPAGASDLADSTSSDATGHGRRSTDIHPGSTERDTSESDFFGTNLTPQLSADDASQSNPLEAESEDPGLLSSPGLEVSQDLASDFSDSPLAAYAGPAESASAQPHRDFDEDATRISSLPPVSPARDADSRNESAIDDGLGVDDVLPLPDVLTPPPPEDLDLHLDPETDGDRGKSAPSQERIADATILVGQDDVNASTFPSYAIATDPEPVAQDLSAVSPSSPEAADSVGGSGREAFTVHAPSSQVDQDAAVAPTPSDPMGLGAAYNHQGTSHSAPGADSKEGAGVADLDASLNRDSQNPLLKGYKEPDSYSVPAAEALPSEPDPLSFGPASVGGEDLDFAFDVSEQREVSEAEALSAEEASSDEDAEPATDNVSESLLIGRDTSEFASPAAPEEEARVGDYDVSSSDLATAVPDRVTDASENDVASLEEDDSDLGVLVSPVSSGHYAAGLGSRGASLGDDRVAADSGGASFAPEPAQTGADPEIALGSKTGGDRRITDLSPLMEQRIQETLEKVAWEAFSDLSETIVKQVINRVEQVAWDVIPEMAETLVREEIRRMKGEED